MAPRDVSDSLTADDADVLLAGARLSGAGLVEHLVAHLLGLLLQHRLLLRDPRAQLVRHLRRRLPLPLQRLRRRRPERRV